MQNVQSTSYWEQKTFLKNVDFLIVGAGIVGYSTALHLRKQYPESKIVILERGILPSGASSKNAGFACFGSATELHSDLQSMPEEMVWETVELRWKGLQYLRSIVGDNGLNLQINGSWDLITEQESELFNSSRDKIDYFNAQLKSITGESEVYSVDDAVGNKFGFNNIKTSIYNRLEGQIDTAKMNDTFYKLIVQANIHVLFGVEAREILEQQNGVTLETNYGEIHSKKVAICTNGFAAQFIKDEDIHPARAQVIITNPIPNLKINGTFHYNQGYYYFRNIDNRILFGGGRNLNFEEETTTDMGTSSLIQTQLRKLLNDIILPGQAVEIEHSWSGIMGVGSSKKPIIKQHSENVFCGVRLGGMGVAIGTLVGKELASLINY
jgi:glycine/D-amino acid oxidase-like deaminating enzyme